MNASTTLSLPAPRGRISITFLPGTSSSESRFADGVGDASLHLALRSRAPGGSAPRRCRPCPRSEGPVSRPPLPTGARARDRARRRPPDAPRHDAVGAAPLETVLTSRRQVERAKQLVDGRRSSDRWRGRPRRRAAAWIIESSTRTSRRHHHRERRFGDVEQGAVDVEEEGPIEGGPRRATRVDLDRISHWHLPPGGETMEMAPDRRSGTGVGAVRPEGADHGDRQECWA